MFCVKKIYLHKIFLNIFFGRNYFQKKRFAKKLNFFKLKQKTKIKKKHYTFTNLNLKN